MVGHRSSYGGKLGAVWIRKKKTTRPRPSLDAVSAAAVEDNGGEAETSIAEATQTADASSDTFKISTNVINSISGGSGSSSSETEADNHHHNDSSSSASADSSPESCSQGSSSSSGGGERRLIGWDEDLCRPIYEIPVPHEQQESSSGEDVKEMKGRAIASAATGNDLNNDADEDNTRSDDDDCDEEDDKDEDGKAFPTIMMSLTQESFADEGAPAKFITAKSGRAVRAARSYGGRKRGRAGLSAAAEAVLDTADAVGADITIPQPHAKRIKRDTKKNKKNSTSDSSHSPTKTDTTADTSESAATVNAIGIVATAEHDMLTPQPYANKSSICNMLDSDVQKSALRDGKSSVATMNKKDNKVLVLDMDASQPNDDDAVASKGGQLDLQLQPKKTKKIRRQYGGRLQPRKSTAAVTKATKTEATTTATAPEATELDFTCDDKDDKSNSNNTKTSISKPNQPCGQTSLSAARAFFEHLDSTHQLAVDNTQQSPALRRNRGGSGGGRAPIRTKRMASIDDSKLQKEYEEYCNTTEVTPLPIGDYVKHRTSFFRSSTICDGLLDDNEGEA